MLLLYIASLSLSHSGFFMWDFQFLSCGLSSSRDGLEGLILSCGNEYIYPCPEDDFTATSESCSVVAGDKVCSSDNQNFSVIKGAELLKR